VPAAIKDLDDLCTRNRIFVERTKGIGVLTHDEAINWSVTGPIARASGVRRDLRKDEPYLCYAANWDGKGAEPVKFQVPVMDGGDVYARFLVRMEEVKQSCKILEQLCGKPLPDTPLNVSDDLNATQPDKREMYFSIEGLIHHFEKIMTNRGIKPPVGEAYAANETATGELGFYVASDGTHNAYRARCRPPSYINYQVFPKLICGHQVSDVVAVLGSLHIIAAELDR
jgi:NADH-quinone oxidoreductase subunit D